MKSAFIDLIANYVDIYLKKNSESAAALWFMMTLAAGFYVDDKEQSEAKIKNVITKVISGFGDYAKEQGFELDQNTSWIKLGSEFAEHMFKDRGNEQESE